MTNGNKAGTTRVEGFTPYAAPPAGRGLWLMQGLGYDQESTPGVLGAAAQLVVFTTGRGTTIGNAIAPVVKLASNTKVFERLGRDLDVNAGTVIDGTETIAAVGERLFAHVLRARAATCSRRPKSTSTASSSSGPSSRCRCDGRRRRRRAGGARRSGAIAAAVHVAVARAASSCASRSSTRRPAGWGFVGVRGRELVE